MHTNHTDNICMRDLCALILERRLKQKQHESLVSKKQG